MKKILLVLCALGFSTQGALADDGTNTWRGMNLDKNFGLQFEVCALKEGKSLADVVKMDPRLKKAWANMDINLSLLRLTPMFSHGLPGQPSADYIDLVMGDIDEFGSAWDKFMASAEGQEILADSGEFGDCRFKFARGTNKMMNAEELDSTDNRIMTMNWCAPKEGVSYEQLKAKHASWLSDNGDDQEVAAWNIVVPAQGAGERQGKFMHLVSYTSMAKLMANENWIANGGGSAAVNDYLSSYASCDGEDTWAAEYIIKASG
jgi:hypothetical protein